MLAIIYWKVQVKAKGYAKWHEFVQIIVVTLRTINMGISSLQDVMPPPHYSTPEFSSIAQ